MKDNHHPFNNPAEYDSNSRLQYDFAMTMLHQANIKSNARLLDIGTGNGDIAAYMAHEIVPKGNVIATDISADMIEFANNKHTPNRDPNPNLGFMVMPAEKNTYQNQFDVVVSFCCLHWVAEQEAALKGIKRALVSNGRAVLLVPQRHHDLYNAIETVVAAPQWQAYFSGFTNPHVFFEKATYQQLLDKAGLATDKLDEVIMPYEYENLESMLDFLAAWLPHVNCVPAEQRHTFMQAIGTEYLKRVPLQGTKVSVPLRMLQIHAHKPNRAPQTTASPKASRLSLFGNDATQHSAPDSKPKPNP